MSSRVIRDGLLDSPRWHGTSHEARCFFIALLLLADDFGLINLQPLFIGRRVFEKRPSDKRLEKLIAELVGVDLLRIYYAGQEEPAPRFGFLPRFRQKMRQMRARHPLPPKALYRDDLDADAKFTEFKALFSKMPAGRLHPVSTSTAEGKGSDLDLDTHLNPETRGRESEGGGGNGAGHADTSPAAATATAFDKGENQKTIWAWATDLGVKKKHGESTDDHQKRIVNEIRAQANAGHAGAQAWLQTH